MQLKPYLPLEPKIWNQIPEEIKGAKSLKSFKEKIKLWVPNRSHVDFVKYTLPIWVSLIPQHKQAMHVFFCFVFSSFSII